MKILIVVSRLPHPLEKADGMTVYRMMKYLAPRHKIYLACFYEREQQLEYLPELEKYCEAIRCVPFKKWRALRNTALGVFSRSRPLQVTYYHDPAMQEAVDGLMEEFQPDLVYSQLIRAAQYLEHKEGVTRVLAMQISQTLNYSRMIRHARSFFHRALYRVEYRKVRRYEPQIARAFDSCLCISPHDKQALQGHESLDNIHFSPHGIDVDYYKMSNGLDKRDNTIVFSGFMETPTNIDTVLYFYERMYPLIKRQVPDVRFVVIGKNPARSIRRLAQTDPSVEVTGWVDDMRDYYARAKVGIDPLRIGAGMQNKLLTGMCMGLPMVCTTIANEGIGAEHGKHVLIADEPKDFAQAVVELLTDEPKARTIAEQAREYVENYWTWEYHFQDLEEYLERLHRQEHPRKPR